MEQKIKISTCYKSRWQRKQEGKGGKRAREQDVQKQGYRAHTVREADEIARKVRARNKKPAAFRRAEKT
jgi:hypothetical protein